MDRRKYLDQSKGAACRALTLEIDQTDMKMLDLNLKTIVEASRFSNNVPIV